MAKTKLSQYRGRLTPAQVADGMNAAIRNALRLADDAHALFDLERHPTAVSIAVLSIEDSTGWAGPHRIGTDQNPGIHLYTCE